MRESDDLDKLRAAFVQPGEPPAAGGCPPSARIWDGVHGALPADELRDVVEHLAACPACAEAWRMALLLDPAAVAATAPPARARPPRSLVYGALAAAAAAALAVVLGIRGFSGAGSPGVTLRGGGVVEQQTATRWLTASDAVLPRHDARILWTGPPQATYELAVKLIDERTGAPRSRPLAVVHRLTATRYLLPEGDLVHLAPGARLQAALTAHLPDGRSETVLRDFLLQ